jgi:hypothetical protein
MEQPLPSTKTKREATATVHSQTSRRASRNMEHSQQFTFKQVGMLQNSSDLKAEHALQWIIVTNWQVSEL